MNSKVRKSLRSANYFKLFIVLAIIFLQYVCLQSSMFPSTTKLIRQGLYAGVNFGIILAINLLGFIIMRKWKLTVVVTGILCLIWGIVNRYVYLFHGSPLYISTILSAKTGFDVAGNYQLHLDAFVTRVVIVSIIEAVAIVALWLLDDKKVKADRKRIGFYVAVFAFDLTFVGLCISGRIPGIKKVAIGATWNAAVREYGFLCCFLKDVQNVLSPISKPEGYDVSILVKEANDAQMNTKEHAFREAPDIILVLNESFFDLGVCSDIKTDVDYMQPLREIAGIHMGNAVVPSVGGGTNNSEYELLTSNSMYLLKSEAPFNYINFENSGNGVVRYLKNLGYDTYGMHYGKATNYSRNKVYPELGFDNVRLGEEEFERHGFYGNRPCLDSDNYKDLIDSYNIYTESSKFMYLLTLQNHGGWEQNNSELDIVHCLKDYGGYTDQINEYLTSVYLSAQAFVELTEYYRNVDRPVIICMVGDHAPSFITSVSNLNVSDDEMAIRQRMVPYMIWANYDVEIPEQIEYASMVDIVPLLIDISGLPMSPYYQLIRELQKNIPLRTSFGKFIDEDGNVGVYGEGCREYDELSKYYAMEYNSIKSGQDYIKELFTP